MKTYLSFFFVLFLLSCKSKSSNDRYEPVYSAGTVERSTDDGYTDGEYCAEIEYYYPRTGTQSTYTLKVEIEDNQLVKIYWPNGGWLDESHFDAPDISDGKASFESDQGVEYTVEIIGKDGDCSYSYTAQDEEEFVDEEEDEVCPKCGDDKYSWKKFCNNCIDEIENTCSKCGSYEYAVYGGICDNCEDEQKCDQCGGYKSSTYDDLCSRCETEQEENEDF